MMIGSEPLSIMIENVDLSHYASISCDPSRMVDNGLRGRLRVDNGAEAGLEEAGLEEAGRRDLRRDIRFDEGFPDSRGSGCSDR